MSARKEQIVNEALALMATQGYAACTMRAVARASGLTLGALQYHYKTREDLLTAMAETIGERYRAQFEAFRAELGGGPLALLDIVDFGMLLPPEPSLDEDRLFPQLWAMGSAEPLMESLLNEIYEEYLLVLDAALQAVGVEEPRADSLAIMAMLEGLTMFIGENRRWTQYAAKTRESIHAMLAARYGIQP